jgi:hypothetical protein
MSRVAVGVRDLGGTDGTGRAALVTLRAAGGAAPEILDRRDLVLVGGDLPARVYHAAAGLCPDDAQPLVRRVAAAAAEAAGAAFDALVADLASEGIDVAAVAIDDTASAALDVPLADVLGSPQRALAAERALYREALAAAAEERGIGVLRYPDADLPGFAAAALGLEADAAEERLAAWGRTVGAPWEPAHRDAALASWLAAAAPRP